MLVVVPTDLTTHDRGRSDSQHRRQKGGSSRLQPVRYLNRDSWMNTWENRRDLAVAVIMRDPSHLVAFCSVAPQSRTQWKMGAERTRKGGPLKRRRYPAEMTGKGSHFATNGKGMPDGVGQEPGRKERRKEGALERNDTSNRKTEDIVLHAGSAISAESGVAPRHGAPPRVIPEQSTHSTRGWGNPTNPTQNLEETTEHDSQGMGSLESGSHGWQWVLGNMETNIPGPPTQAFPQTLPHSPQKQLRVADPRGGCSRGWCVVKPVGRVESGS